MVLLNSIILYLQQSYCVTYSSYLRKSICTRIYNFLLIGILLLWLIKAENLHIYFKSSKHNEQILHYAQIALCSGDNNIYSAQKVVDQGKYTIKYELIVQIY